MGAKIRFDTLWLWDSSLAGLGKKYPVTANPIPAETILDLRVASKVSPVSVSTQSSASRQERWYILH